MWSLSMNFKESFVDKMLPTVVLPAPAIPIRDIESFMVKMVEPVGIEPTTSSVQGMRSPS